MYGSNKALHIKVVHFHFYSLIKALQNFNRTNNHYYCIFYVCTPLFAGGISRAALATPTPLAQPAAPARATVTPGR